MAAPLIVEIVELSEPVWHGEARQVIVRTTDGDLGILSGHVATAGVLVPGRVVIDPVDGQRIEGQIDGGFVSVDGNRVTIVADHYEGPGESR
ncbi:F0F1 ATP synthase subunit epsilon [Kocuria sp. JC486]|uniref:F0F1 ATP synthase subunit epsilon n=1 Tax=Kocuria sp. JC486 TaxID=1970736 RepID=UPI00141D779D|nr:F0F1 ATP synthase subunit epsilon [Kocuria sp. JC486]NHU84561.1 F0F1 ATP synthase subunit epsilon [Kocuria sp. JC486]